MWQRGIWSPARHVQNMWKPFKGLTGHDLKVQGDSQGPQVAAYDRCAVKIRMIKCLCVGGQGSCPVCTRYHTAAQLCFCSVMQLVPLLPRHYIRAAECVVFHHLISSLSLSFLFAFSLCSAACMPAEHAEENDCWMSKKEAPGHSEISSQCLGGRE